jgi:hypothetical protein
MICTWEALPRPAVGGFFPFTPILPVACRSDRLHPHFLFHDPLLWFVLTVDPCVIGLSGLVGVLCCCGGEGGRHGGRIYSLRMAVQSFSLCARLSNNGAIQDNIVEGEIHDMRCRWSIPWRRMRENSKGLKRGLPLCI